MNIGKKYPIGAFKGDGFVKIFEDTIQSLDSYTKLMIHGDSIYDSTGKTVTMNGTAAVSTVQSKFSKIGRSILLDGDSDYMTLANSADWEFGSGAFTVEWWEYRTATTSYKSVVSRDNATSYCPFILGYSDTGYNRVYITSNGSSWDIASNKNLGTIDLNTWNHFAVVRSGNDYYTFKNGVQQDTWNNSSSIYANSNALSIGMSQGGNFFPGYLTEIRISKGIARWTSNFTPPTNIYEGRRIYTIVTGINGDVDEEYKINMFVSQIPAGSNPVLVCPNGDTTTNYAYQRFYGWSTSSGADYGSAVPGLYLLCYGGTNYSSRGEMRLLAKTGFPRIATTSSSLLTNSTTVTYVHNSSNIWKDTSSNITSLLFYTQSILLLEVGTYLSVWKKIKST